MNVEPQPYTDTHDTNNTHSTDVNYCSSTSKSQAIYLYIYAPKLSRHDLNKKPGHLLIYIHAPKLSRYVSPVISVHGFNQIHVLFSELKVENL